MADASLETDAVRRGRAQLKLAERSMKALSEMGERFKASGTFKGVRIGVCLHLTKETGVLCRALAAGGARLSCCGCNAFSTQDDVCAALAAEGMTMHAKHGCSNEEFHVFLRAVASEQNNIIIDDGADLTNTILEHGVKWGQGSPSPSADLWGGCEQTTSGVIRLRNMSKAGVLKFPMVLTNENKTKHLLDNFYGTGQSTWDGILRATTAFVAGKVVCVLGYGECGAGIALRAKGLGAKQVIVTDVHPFKALKAVYDGHDVMTGMAAAPHADFFITATGSKSVVTAEMALQMKDGAYICNVGQFANEVDMPAIGKLATSRSEARPGMEQLDMPNGRAIFVLGGCNLVNLACAEGHPSEVMVTSFMGQALACKYISEHKEKLSGCVDLPEELDDQIAALQLKALGISFDGETEEQKRYLSAFNEGTDDH